MQCNNKYCILGGYIRIIMTLIYPPGCSNKRVRLEVVRWNAAHVLFSFDLDLWPQLRGESTIPRNHRTAPPGAHHVRGLCSSGLQSCSLFTPAHWHRWGATVLCSVRHPVTRQTLYRTSSCTCQSNAQRQEATGKLLNKFFKKGKILRT